MSLPTIPSRRRSRFKWVACCLLLVACCWLLVCVCVYFFLHVKIEMRAAPYRISEPAKLTEECLRSCLVLWSSALLGLLLDIAALCSAKKIDRQIAPFAPVETLGQMSFTQQNKVMQMMLDNSTVCLCCDRHQDNKPMLWSPDKLVHGSFAKSPKNACPCPCRHNARVLCRLHPEYKAGRTSSEFSSNYSTENLVGTWGWKK